MILDDQPVDRRSFNRARDTMTHRGPDAGESVFLQNDYIALGHRRLSILDLSVAANQPMQLDSLWVSFNGEIYNYPELRKKLEIKGCQFRTSSDTEVLLHGYRVWGENLCDHLSGMFAFVIWDDTSKEMFIARDHVGQKPLYYYQVGKQFVAASEIKAIKALYGSHLELRQESLIDFQYFDFVPEPFTWYENIKCVLPGHRMKISFKNNSFNSASEQYWNFTPDPEPTPISQSNALDFLGEHVEKAVKSHLLADVEVGAFLSGGADSTAIVSTATQFLDDPIKTFSIGFGNSDGDELPLARETANTFGSIHTEGIVSKEDYLASMGVLFDIFDMPFADDSLIPTERVSALAAKDVKVVLTGDGGDEAFGGYLYGRYLSPFLQLKPKHRRNNLGGLRNSLWSSFDKLSYMVQGAEKWRNNHSSLLRGQRVRSRVDTLLGEDMAKKLKSYDPNWVYDQYRNSEIDTFRLAQWMSIKISLPNKYLVKVDRSSMRHSLEARSPFLSHTLLEAMLNLPTNIRNPENNWYKGLFRNWLTNKIPENVLNAQKRGFAIPRTWTLVPPSGNTTQLLPRCIEASFINPSAVSRITKEPRVYWKFLQLEQALEKGLF